MSTEKKVKPKCKYWEKCFRNNSTHLRQFLHPSDEEKKKTSKSPETMGESRNKTDTADEDMDTGVKTDRKCSKRKTHTLSQSDNEDDAAQPSPAKKTTAGETATPEKKPDSVGASGSSIKRVKCRYWDKCYQKSAKHLEDFCHPGDSDEDEAADPKTPMTRSLSLKPLNEIKDGDKVNFDGGVTVSREGDSYRCSCKGWHAQRSPYNKRTCKHLKDYLGTEFEKRRCQLDKTKPKCQSHIQVNLLLAHKYDENVNDPTGWWISEKLDGVRAFWNGRCFYSRLGNAFIAPEWFTKDFPTDMHLDGELFGGRGQFQSTVSIVKTPEDERWKKIKYEVFDSPNLGREPFESRYEKLKSYFESKKPPYAHLCEQTKCTGKKQLDEELKKIIKLGGEGLMIRQPKSIYERTRSHTLLKIKKFYDAEAVVIGHTRGKGRNQHCTGALRCRMANGTEFSVGSGLSDAERHKPPKIGSIITYKFQEYTKGGHPRFPSYIGIRIDMDEPKDADVPKKPSDD